MSDEKETKADRPLPAGVEWAIGPRGNAGALVRRDGAKKYCYAGFDGGRWYTFADPRMGTVGVGGFAVDSAAAQRAAEAALWRAGAFGWGLCSAHRAPEKGCRICDLGTFTSLPAALEALGVKRATRPVEVAAVRAPPAGDRCPACGAILPPTGIGCGECAWMGEPLPDDAVRAPFDTQAEADATAERASREPSAPALDAPVYGYAASEDAEEWSAPYSSREEAINAASEDSDFDGGEIWIVKGRHLDPAAAMPSARWIIEMIPDGAAEQNWHEGAVEVLEATIGKLPPEAIAELDASLATWARRWCPMRGSWEGTGRSEKVREASDGDEG